MPVRETEAIILRTYPLGEADRLVSFFSRAQGRMRGVARGARRPKSRFGSTLELLSYVRVWFYEKETQELVRINQCELQESFLAAQSDLECGMTLALLSEIVENILPEHEANDAAFRLLLATARRIEQTRRTFLPLCYFSLWMVRLAGWLPELERCARCGKALAGQTGHCSVTRPGVTCANCRLPGMHALSAQGLALARSMLTKPPEAFSEDEIPRGTGADLLEFLLDIIEHHMERKLKSRRMRTMENV
jgi:DNA repair protein RecO (recombination protein O)